MEYWIANHIEKARGAKGQQPVEGVHPAKGDAVEQGRGHF